jgi:hypothetical protein
MTRRKPLPPLEPCAHCGDSYPEIMYFAPENYYFECSCGGMHIMMDYKTKRAMVNAWNRAQIAQRAQRKERK